MNYKPNIILIDRLAQHLPTTQTILKGFKGVDFTVIEDVKAIKRPADLSEAKKTLLISTHRGDAFKPCQGTGSGHLCCNYWVIDLISGCPMDCSYCILQHYLENNPLLTIYANIDEILTRAAIYFAEHKDKMFRVGTGELSDSLALDHITGFSRKIIEYFSPHKNVVLELKTKTSNIGHLLKPGCTGSRLRGNGRRGERVVISWSVNPQKIIESEEVGSASLSERFEAARRAVQAGYRIGFHFDPIIYSEGWEGQYKQVADQIVQNFPFEKIAWISIGTLRFPPQMKEIVIKRFPKSRIFWGELVPINGKVRYFRPIREEIYGKMIEWLKPLKQTTPIYLCMETRPVWQKIMPEVGTSNASIERHVCLN